MSTIKNESERPLFQPIKPGGNFIYLKQIAIPGGIHSCYSTSILNGWINQGSLTYPEADQIQRLMIENSDQWFGREPIQLGGMTVRTFNRNPYRFAEYIERQLSKAVVLDVYMRKDLVNLEAHIQNMGSSRFAIVGGNAVHTILIAEYDRLNDTFTKIDPRCPNDPMTIGAKDFAKMVSQNDDHIVVLKANSNHLLD